MMTDTCSLQLFVRFPEDCRILGHAQTQGPFGSGEPVFRGEALRELIMGVGQLTDAAGEVVGTYTEFSVPARGESYGPGENLNTLTLVFPGRGSLFIEQHVDVGVFARLLESLRAQSSTWSGHASVHPTLGPAAKGWGRIVGGTGLYSDIRGRMQEITSVTRLLADGGFIGTTEFQLYFESSS